MTAPPSHDIPSTQPQPAGLEIHPACDTPNCYCRYAAWSFDEAARWFHERYAACERVGWVPALVGSVPRDGMGNDLDVVFLAVAPDAIDLPAALERASDWRLISASSGLDGRHFRVYADEHNRIIDATFMPYSTLYDREGAC